MKYEKGDKLVIINNCSGHFFENDEVVVVIEVTDYDYLMENENGDSWWVVDEDVKEYEEVI